ncbi:MAG: oligopeptidase A [Candidatus Berkiellales bacterium]
MKNPLLEDHTLPPFDKIQPIHVTPAIEELIAHNLQAIDQLVAHQTAPTWESLVAPMEELDDKLNQAWSPVSHLNSVKNTEEIRQAHHQCLPKLSDYGTKVGQNQLLFAAYQSLKDSQAFKDLTKAQQKVITNAIRDFKLSGVALTAEKREKFAALSKTLSELQSQFQDNVMDATDHWYHDVVDEKELAGLPEQSKTVAKLTAEEAKGTGWRLTLDYPCYNAVMTYADNAKLRQKMHQAYATRSSDKGEDPKWDNTALIEKILATRYEMAKLLDFENYAKRSLATKMAKTPQQVMQFLLELAKKVKPFAQRDYAELVDFAQGQYDVNHLAPHDIAYYSEKLRQSKYAISQETLRAYFPVAQVISGLFAVVKRLYGLEIKEQKKVSTWYEGVQFFEIYDQTNQLRGMFYFDLFARNHKRNGAWMDEARVCRRLKNGELQHPVAYLTCNFRAPLGDVPSLLTHDEVLTLFHEFGHGLHHMLTKIDCASVSGINGVPWDAIELPSQFMENWCWQNEALKLISSHYQTKERLPDELLKKMHQAKNFQAGMMLLRQLEFSLFDFRLHNEFNPELGGRTQPILDEIRAEYRVAPTAPYDRFQHSFTHIFAGGYAAGYYSYLWAEVLASDAFSKFEEEGIFNTTTGKAFLEKILEKGGSQDPDILFKDFRGRAPMMEPFLRHRGMEE